MCDTVKLIENGGRRLTALKARPDAIERRNIVGKLLTIGIAQRLDRGFRPADEPVVIRYVLVACRPHVSSPS